MKTQQGFVSTSVLIATILGLIVVVGGIYFVMQSNQSPQTTLENSLDTLPTTRATIQATTKTSAQQEEDETIILVNLVRGTSEQEATPLVRLLKENRSVSSAEYVSPEKMLADYIKRHGGPPRDAPSGTVGNPFDGMILVHVKEPSLRAEVAAFIKAQNDSVVQYVDW